MAWKLNVTGGEIILNFLHSAFMCAKSLQSCLTLCNPMNHSPPDSSVHGDSPDKNTELGCHFLIQGIFLTQGLNNVGLLHYRWILYHLSHVY